MNANTIVRAAVNHYNVAYLAAKHAETQSEWMQINQAASEFLRLLHGIEQDDSLRVDLREQARVAALGLAIQQRESCSWVEDLKSAEVAA